jgi:hypothetical protein
MTSPYVIFAAGVVTGLFLFPIGFYFLLWVSRAAARKL